MKLKDLKGIIYSDRDGVEMVIVYNANTFKDIENSCSIEYAIKEYGDYEVKRITHEYGCFVVGIVM